MSICITPTEKKMRQKHNIPLDIYNDGLITLIIL